MTQVQVALRPEFTTTHKSIATNFKKVCPLSDFRLVCEIAKKGYAVVDNQIVSVFSRIGTSGKKASHYFIASI